jgi:centrosome and spindle pole-associated protein 1
LQEGVVSRITDQLRAKLDRTDLEDLQDQIRTIVRAPSQDDTDAQLGKVCLCHQQHLTSHPGQYGVSPEDAAGMRKGIQKFNCISCNRPIKTDAAQRPPSAGVLVPKGNQAFISFSAAVAGLDKELGRVCACPANAQAAIELIDDWDSNKVRCPFIASRLTLCSKSLDQSLVEVSELPASFRSAGGAHTSPKVMSQQRARSARPSVDAIIEVWLHTPVSCCLTL